MTGSRRATSGHPRASTSRARKRPAWAAAAARSQPRPLLRTFPGGAGGRLGAGAGDQFRGGQPAAADRAPRLRVGGEPTAGADRGCCPPRACRCRIAEVTCTSPDRVRDVIHNFDADGFDALCPRHRGGRPATFSADQRAEITKVARGRPTDHGLPVFDAGAGRSWPSTWSPRGGRQGVVDDYQPPRTAPAAGPGGRVRSTGAERRRPRPTRTTRPRRTGGSSCLRSPTPQRRPGPGDPTVIVSLDEFGPLNPASPEEQARMIGRYLGWRNRMRTTSSYRRSWPGRRFPEAALETPEPAMRQSCATVRAAGGSFCRTGRGCHVDRPPCRPSALAKELAGPGAGAVMGTRPPCSWTARLLPGWAMVRVPARPAQPGPSARPAPRQ
jgi:hypothetical protein